MDTKTTPPILDVCCGGRMFYFDKQDSRVLFQDIREIDTTLCDGRAFSIKPDVVGDFTNMVFADNTFSMVVFDPPHLRWWGKDPEKPPTGYQQLNMGHSAKIGVKHYPRVLQNVSASSVPVASSSSNGMSMTSKYRPY